MSPFFHGPALAEYLRDVRIEQSVLPPFGVADHDGVLWRSKGARFQISVPQVGQFLVADGRRIVIEPAEGAAPEDMLRILHMTPLAALCFQRATPALHAAAAGKAGGAVLIAGDSSVGKSTLLAALMQRGWTALADDLALVDLSDTGRPIVIPSYPEILLWPDAAKELAVPIAATPTASGRNPIRLSNLHFDQGLPLRAIFRLGFAAGDEVETEAPEGAERFKFANRIGYNSRVADALFARVPYLERTAVLASLPLHVLRRPSSRWSIHELADAVERLTP